MASGSLGVKPVMRDTRLKLEEALRTNIKVSSTLFPRPRCAGSCYGSWASFGVQEHWGNIKEITDYIGSSYPQLDAMWREVVRGGKTIFEKLCGLQKWFTEKIKAETKVTEGKKGDACNALIEVLMMKGFYLARKWPRQQKMVWQTLSPRWARVLRLGNLEGARRDGAYIQRACSSSIPEGRALLVHHRKQGNTLHRQSKACENLWKRFCQKNDRTHDGSYRQRHCSRKKIQGAEQRVSNRLLRTSNIGVLGRRRDGSDRGSDSQILGPCCEHSSCERSRQYCESKGCEEQTTMRCGKTVERHR